MRKILFFILVSILMTGCSKDSSIATEHITGDTNQVLNVTQQPVATPTPLQKEPIKPQYPKIIKPTSIEQIEYAVDSEDKLCIYDGNKYGFLDDNGNEITPFRYDYAYPYSEGLACVRLGEKFGFIDEKGNASIPLTYDRACPFSEGLAYFAKGDKYGFINHSGAVAFLLNCDSVSSFKENLAYYSDSGKYGYIDKTGKVAIKPVYDDASYFQNGLAKVRVGLKLGVIDKNGKEIAPADYDNISFDNGLIITELGGKYGCIDKNGNLIFKPSYDSITMLPESNSAIVYLGDQPAIVDFKGNSKVSARYDDLYYDSEYSDGMIEVDKNDKYGFLDESNLTEVVSPIYDWISVHKKGRAVVRKGDKYGVINNKNGTIIIPLNYNDIKIFDNGMLALNQGGKYRLADRNGKIINENRYESIDEFGSCYIVNAGDKYGILDENGSEVIAPVYDYIPTDEYNRVYHSENCCMATTFDSECCDYIIVTGQDKDTDLSNLLLQNEITPKIKPFYEYQKSGSVNIPFTDDKTSAVSVANGMNNCYKIFKLYDIDGSGNPIMYFYASSLVREGSGMSYSGLYSAKVSSLKELVTGYECGGTMGGNVASLFRDPETSKILIGDENHFGGFGGSAYGCDIYEYYYGETKEAASYLLIGQTVGNYDKNDLIKNAGLFYDENNIPYNKDTILHADYVTEYRLGDKQIAFDEYKKEADKYKILRDFLFWLQ